jgi:hypothetical protein
MQVTRKSAISGITRTVELPITEEQLLKWQTGLVAQQAFPHLNADHREFIITGITQEEWDNAFANEI